jgi:hypothetical protein
VKIIAKIFRELIFSDKIRVDITLFEVNYLFEIKFRIHMLQSYLRKATRCY